MPTLATVSGMAILIYYNDHEPAHFHVRAATFRAKFKILDLAVIEVTGRMRQIEMNGIRRWAEGHRTELLENRSRAQRFEPLRKIEN